MTVPRRPLVISHRTNMGSMPENSVAGIRAALADGADGIEIDVRATADGTAVLLHDETTERIGGDARSIHELTLAEAQAIRLAGTEATGGTLHAIPTLRDVLAEIRGRARLVIEIKQREIEQLVADEVERAQAAEWCWTWAFDPVVARAAREAMPAVPVALNSSAAAAERLGYASAVGVAADAGLAAVSLAHAGVTAEVVSEARSHGLEVYTWTVNELADITRVIAAGVDAVCGDYPARIRAAIEG